MDGQGMEAGRRLRVFVALFALVALVVSVGGVAQGNGPAATTAKKKKKKCPKGTKKVGKKCKKSVLVPVTPVTPVVTPPRPPAPPAPAPTVVRATLSWEDENADLDLHAYTATGHNGWAYDMDDNFDDTIPGLLHSPEGNPESITDTQAPFNDPVDFAVCYYDYDGAPAAVAYTLTYDGATSDNTINAPGEVDWTGDDVAAPIDCPA